MKKLSLLCLVLVIAGCTVDGPPSTATPTAGILPVTKQAEDGPHVAQSPTVDATEDESDRARQTQSSTDEAPSHFDLLTQLLFSISTLTEGQEILGQIEASGDTRFVAGLIDVLRYQPALRREIGQTLNQLTGQVLPPDWFEWVEWAGQHPEIASFADYPGWKGRIYATIDPSFLRFVRAGMRVDPGSRVEEIVWGGVVVDGIPALDNPKMVEPSAANYLVPDERVFGVSINGDTRAYSARFLDWHEMLNDVVGGEPVSLAY